MREIKFRVWDSATKEMIQECQLEDFIIGNYPNSIYEDILAGNVNYIFMQYTGLKDKNGEEIYEGDIIKDVGGFISHVIYKGNTHFSSFLLKYPDKPCLLVDKPEYIEVIGNIYENTELLNNEVNK